MRLEVAIWWRMGIKAGKIDILAKRFIRLRDDMNRKYVYSGCVILMMAAILTVSAQEGGGAINGTIVSGATKSCNESLNETSEKSELAEAQAGISAQNKTAAECNISIPKNNTYIMPLGSKNEVASFQRPAFVIGGGGEYMMQRANEARLPAKTVMDLSRAINIETPTKTFDIKGDGGELLNRTSAYGLPAETVMDLSATVLPRYKIRNIN